ncbi:hypothetical protein KFK09_020222 [Dendrobium nobile]|uniref:Uncharacterized protein n=1 Tax=Dendrobium nobile TaxID=94219 RepID=A0A8T3ASQ0_DENNO|nr:hypothetical protein KFK09_020222 [Dendrobium nobile]
MMYYHGLRLEYGPLRCYMKSCQCGPTQCKNYRKAFSTSNGIWQSELSACLLMVGRQPRLLEELARVAALKD